MIITISGLPGSGTSTVSKILSRRIGIKVVSAGDIFRKMAKEKGLTLEEFGESASNDEGIDRELDRFQKKIASDARSEEEDVIIEGRLSAWMVEPDLAIFVTAPQDVRTARVSHREGALLSDAATGIRERELCEAARYEEYYGIDINDLGVYDLVINSGNWDQHGVARIVAAAVDAHQTHK
ncbi:MAG: AAA family ATPase [Euryarchaeota archaeon]|nr:AAA family ATPase [Euryarchaeota archaeon]